MSTLRGLGIVRGKTTKAAELFEMLVPNFWAISYSKPTEYVREIWNSYKKYIPHNKDLNGRFFEYVLATLFIRENILPIYLNAKVAFVPNVNYDLMLYTKERGPICLSIKTSLRERYKQADLEAVALKYVHRKALSYLVTLDEPEAIKNRARIRTGDIIGLDDIILAISDEFNNLVDQLKKYDPEEPPTVKVITSTQVIRKDQIQKLKLNEWH